MEKAKSNQEKSLKNISYDITVLPKGFLFRNKVKSQKNKYLYFLPLLAAPIGVTLSLFKDENSKTLISQGILIAQAGLIVYIFFAAIYAYAWEKGIKKYLYDKGFKQFLEINKVLSANIKTISSNIPPSVKNMSSHHKSSRGAFLPTDHGEVLVYDYAFQTGEGKSTRYHQYAIATLTFDKRYPHIYLDGKVNGRDDSYSSKQEVRLEGNFNEYFKLFMPDGSAAGSLTVLSPDIMQLFIDIGKPFDIEIKENKLYIISTGKAFIQEDLKNILTAADGIYNEFAHLEKNWKPVYDIHGKPFDLIGFNFIRTYLILFGVSLIYMFSIWIIGALFINWTGSNILVILSAC